MAAAVLTELLGYPQATLATRPLWTPVPGLIRHWQISAATESHLPAAGLAVT